MKGPIEIPGQRWRWDLIKDLCNENGYKTIAEIGVWKGTNVQRILERLKVKVFFAIDKGRHIPFAHWLLDSPYSKLVHYIALSSERASGFIKDGTLDLVFIDANHGYKWIEEDIKFWLPKIRKGGILSGHDYDHPRGTGVKQAVDEAFEGKEYYVQEEEGKLKNWWIYV